MKLNEKFMALTSAVMIAVSATACSSSDSGNNSSSESSQSPSQTENTFTISADSIAETLGAGWNYGNTLEANSGGHPSETVWGNPEASQEMINAVADAGFSTVRVPVSYLDYIDDNNAYKVDETWLNRVQEVVDYCYKRELNVIINVHGDGYNSINGGWLLCNGDNQDYIKEKYAALWQQIADKFATYDEHLIFESMNEEFNGDFGEPVREQYENINAYNQIFIDTVRASGENNTHRWLMFPGWNTNIDFTVGDYGFQLPTDNNNTAGENRMILSVHCYDPWDYCGEEKKKTFLWGERGQQIVEINKANPKNLASWGDEEFLEGQMKKLKESFIDKGVHVVIGEFGCIDKTLANAGIPNQIAENRAYYDGYLAGIAATYGITPIYWDNGYNGQYGFGLFTRATAEQSQPEIIQAIVNAVKNKDPKAGLETRIKSYDDSAGRAEKLDEVHAYLGIQTEIYTFRNSYSDGAYGHDSEWFNTLIKWEDIDGDNKDDIVDTGATFEDASIKDDGTYTVGVSGYDFSGESGTLNMLFVSTDFKFSNAVVIKDVVLSVDDKEIPVKNPIIAEDNEGNMYIELVNKYNESAPAIEYDMPKESLKITFTIEGVSNILK